MKPGGGGVALWGPGSQAGTKADLAIDRQLVKLPHLRMVSLQQVARQSLFPGYLDEAEEGITGSDDYVLHAVEFVGDGSITYRCA